MNNNITQAIKVFKEGGIVIFPTDTAVGIGCRIDSNVSVNEIFTIKGRPTDKSMLILASSIEMAQKYADFSTKTFEFAKRNWPAGITLILPVKKNMVSEIITAGKETIAIRVPASDVIREIIDAIGVPIVAPSANYSGEKTPYLIEEVDKRLIEQVKMVLQGECTYKKESTIIDTTLQPWRIVREGAVKIEVSNL